MVKLNYIIKKLILLGEKMVNIKILRSIDLISITKVKTGINFILGIILAFIVVITLSTILKLDVGIINIFFGIVFGTLILSISFYFGITFLFNYFAKYLKNISLEFSDGNKLTKISLVPATLIITVISLIVSLILYPVISVGLPFQLIDVTQTLLQNGGFLFGLIETQVVALLFYQFLISITQPEAILVFFVLSVVTSVATIILFNLIAPKLGGINLSLSKVENWTKIDAIDSKSVSLIFGIIFLIIGFIVGLIFTLTSGDILTFLHLTLVFTIIGLIYGLVGGFIVSALYNFIAPKLGQVKLELEDK
jgi:hypothetical protein